MVTVLNRCPDCRVAPGQYHAAWCPMREHGVSWLPDVLTRTWDYDDFPTEEDEE